LARVRALLRRAGNQVPLVRLRDVLAQPMGRLRLARAGDVVQFALDREQRHVGAGPLARNSGEVVGVFGTVNVNQPGFGMRGYASSLDTQQLDGLERLLTTLWSLILPAFAGGEPLLVLIFFWTFRRTPVEMYEAARLEGADAWLAYRQIALPMARPTIAAVIVLAFVLFWNDFTNPVLYLYRPQTYTLPVGVQILKQLDATNWPLLMAGATFMTIPIIVVFFILQPLFLSDHSIASLLEKG